MTAVREGGVSWGVTELQDEKRFELNWTIKRFSANKGAYEVKSPSFKGPWGNHSWFLTLREYNNDGHYYLDLWRPKHRVAKKGRVQFRLLDQEGKPWKEVKRNCDSGFIPYHAKGSSHACSMMVSANELKWKKLGEDDTLRFQCYVWIQCEAKLKSGRGSTGPHSTPTRVPQDLGKLTPVGDHPLRGGGQMWGVTVTEIQEDYLEFQWNLVGFSSAFKRGYEMKSPAFKDPKGPHEWYLELFPANKVGKIGNDYHLYLCRSGPTVSTRKLNARCTVNLLNRHGTPFQKTNIKKNRDFKAQAKWYTKMMIPASLRLRFFKWANKIGDDTLRFTCSIWIEREAKATTWFDAIGILDTPPTVTVAHS